MIDFEARLKARVKSDDRILVLKPIEGQNVLSSTSLIDNRLFQGTNTVHAVKTIEGLWKIKFAAGVPPLPLQQTFTKFDRLLTYARNYFKKRGVEIVEVIGG